GTRSVRGRTRHPDGAGRAPDAGRAVSGTGATKEATEGSAAVSPEGTRDGGGGGTPGTGRMTVREPEIMDGGHGTIPAGSTGHAVYGSTRDVMPASNS